MARTDTSEGQAVWQPGEAEADIRFREGDIRLRLVYDDDDDEDLHHIEKKHKLVVWVNNVFGMSSGSLLS